MNYEIEITKYDPAGNRSLEVLTGAKLPSVFGNPAENAKPLRLYELGTNYHSQPGEEFDQSLELKLRFNPAASIGPRSGNLS